MNQLKTVSPTSPVRVRGWDREAFIAAKYAQQIPHAILFHGEAGLGKLLTAQQYAAILLCQAEKGDLPCGHCQSCRLQRAHTHPDYQFICPEENGHAIKIDQIRAVTAFLQQTPQQAGFRVVIVAPADTLNHAAANSLLKSLEEPGDNTVLLLVTDRLMALAPTLRSRCVKYPFLIPDHDTSRQWLQSENAADFLQGLREVFLGELSPVALAQRLQAQALDPLLSIWLSALHHVIGYAQGVDWKLPAGWVDLLDHPKKRLSNSRALFQFIDTLYQARGLIQSSINPNQQLLLENLLIEWYYFTINSA